MHKFVNELLILGIEINNYINLKPIKHNFCNYSETFSLIN